MSSAPEIAAEEKHPSETLEWRSMCDMFDAAPDDLRQRMGWRCEIIGGALVSAAAKVQSIIINRTLGLGLFEPASPGAIAGIKDAYAAAGIDRYFVHVGPSAESQPLKGWLVEAGLEPRRRWMKFERDTRPAPARDTVLKVAKIGSARLGEQFSRIICDAFDLGEAAEGLFTPLIGRPGWHLYGAFHDDQLVGTGTLFVNEGRGYLNFGATAPPWRGRGAQSAILAARIDAARELGCSTLYTDTGEDVPGDPQHSYRNIERAGFRPSYLRDNYAPMR